ncbi:MAG: hypothetical protein ACI3X6_01135, partial [Alloprevotella sp.]
IIFPMCLKVKISLIFAEIFSGQISLVIIILKISPHVALTIANAKLTFCAGSEKTLTSFAFLA